MQILTNERIYEFLFIGGILDFLKEEKEVLGTKTG